VIKKKFRQKEKEVKKVLSKWKPFFSYGIVLNYIPNKLNHNRFAIVIWAKSVKNNVERVFFRRKFYDFSLPYIYKEKNKQFFDFVFVVKKQNKLNKKDLKNVLKFETDLKFLFKKIF
jgi:ribonuclease P protein component